MRQGTPVGLVVALAIASAACGRPSAEEIARLRAEAREEDARQRAGLDAGPPAEAWSIEIRSSVPGQKATLTAARLEETGDKEIVTIAPAADTGYKAEHRYKGMLLSKALDDLGGLDGGADTEVTILGADGYWTALRADDVKYSPILLAVLRDGRRIPRNLGGPVSLALPISSHPDLAVRYGENAWCFYVSGIIVGRPRARLRIDDAVREPSELVAKGATRRRQRVRFRRGWSNDEVVLDGVRLAALFPSAKAVKVYSFGREPGSEVTITAEEMRACDPLVVLGDAPMTHPLAPNLGGPAVLAPLPGCGASWAQAGWPAFLDTLQAVP
ncbi:MAG: hypothetical protein JST00_33020 [Deltaproteobacteria bacterium]|nr:hypothetical protein [Deltaproteobacteria bacterium]